MGVNPPQRHQVPSSQYDVLQRMWNRTIQHRSQDESLVRGTDNEQPIPTVGQLHWAAHRQLPTAGPYCFDGLQFGSHCQQPWYNHRRRYFLHWDVVHLWTQCPAFAYRGETHAGVDQRPTANPSISVMG